MILYDHSSQRTSNKTRNELNGKDVVMMVIE